MDNEGVQVSTAVTESSLFNGLKSSTVSPAEKFPMLLFGKEAPSEMSLTPRSTASTHRYQLQLSTKKVNCV